MNRDIPGSVPDRVKTFLDEQGIPSLRPCQAKAVEAGLFEGNNLLVATPTASGKTLVGEMAMVNHSPQGKSLYIVPLRALASEKRKDFKERHELNVSLATGEADSSVDSLKHGDYIIATSEKVDSLLRHHASWLEDVRCVVVDEIHLLNDKGRGPTLEVVLTLLRRIVKDVQIIGLSATIGNPENLAGWLDAELVQDDWRPVELREGVFFDDEVEFIE